jgi:hypothetical protein
MIRRDCFRSIAAQVRSIANDCSDLQTARRIQLLANELEEIARTPQSSTSYDFSDIYAGDPRVINGTRDDKSATIASTKNSKRRTAVT